MTERHDDDRRDALAGDGTPDEVSRDVSDATAGDARTEPADGDARDDDAARDASDVHDVRDAHDAAGGDTTAMLRLLRDEPEHWGHRPEIPGCRIIDEVARGGQGAVYRAERLADHRTVAVKVLHPRFAEHAVGRRRFEREAVLAATLDHPGIVQILGHGLAADGRPYLVMDLVAGRPLSAVAADPTLDATDRHAIFRRLCDAVGHAHRRGVMHRDLKPANVLVDDGGHVTVLDFGLARPEARSETAARVSATGEFVGSIPWAAPEQLSGDPEAADVRTDVHALGALLYLLLTGHPPYDVDAGLGTLITAITTGPPPDPRRRDRSIDADLAAVVRRAMAKDPDDRYASASELAEDVRRVGDGEPIADRYRSTWRRTQRSLVRARRVVTASIAIVVILTGATLVAVDRTRAATDARDETAESLRRERTARREAQSSLAALEDALGTIDPTRVDGQEPTLAHVLDAIEQRYEAPGFGRRQRGNLASVVARVRMHRGEYAEAIRAAQTAIGVLTTEEDRQRRAGAYESLGLAKHASGDPVAGAADLERAAGLRHELADEATWAGAERWYRDRARHAEISAAVAHAQAGDLDRAEATLRSVLDTIELPDVDDLLQTATTTRDGRVLPRPQPPTTPDRLIPQPWVIATYRMGEIADARQDFARAQALFDRALRASAFSPDLNPLSIAGIHRSAADSALRRIDAEAAFAHADAALAIIEPVMQHGHPMVAVDLSVRAEARARLGDFDGALHDITRAAAMIQAVMPGESRHLNEIRRHGRNVVIVAREQGVAIDLFGTGDGAAAPAPAPSVPPTDDPAS